MTDLSVTNQLDALTEPGERRMGVAAATQLLMRMERDAEAVGAYDPTEGADARYDAAWAGVQQHLLTYLRAFAQQSSEAQEGFAFVFADYLFKAWAGGGIPHLWVYDRSHTHAYPPLTPTQRVDLQENKGTHNGEAVKPAERKRLADRWLKEDPGTVREGRAAAVAFLAEATSENPNPEQHGSRPTPAFETALDAYLSRYATAGHKARAGFRSILRDVLSEGYRSINVDPAKFYAKREFHGGKPGPDSHELAAVGQRWLRLSARSEKGDER